MPNLPADINIVPIFQQGPYVWDAFADIHFSDSKLKYQKLKKYRTAAQKSWKRNEHNFAFAIMRGKTMLGYTKGYTLNGYTYIDELSLLPKYQNTDIGGFLITNAEYSTALDARTMICAPGVRKLIKRADFLEYKFADCEDGSVIRDMRECGYMPRPIFKVTPYIRFGCEDIYKENLSALKSNRALNRLIKHTDKLHKPTFIHTYDCEITGVLTGDVSSDAAYIYDMYTTKASYGKSADWYLLDRFELYARKMDAKKIILTEPDLHRDKMELFERKGFNVKCNLIEKNLISR